MPHNSKYLKYSAVRTVIFLALYSWIAQAADVFRLDDLFIITDEVSLAILKERLARGNIKRLKMAGDSSYNNDSGFEIMATLLKNDTNVIEFLLLKPKLSDIGAFAITKIIQENHRLKSIVFHFRDSENITISDKGYTAILQAFKSNTTITVFELAIDCHTQIWGHIEREIRFSVKNRIKSNLEPVGKYAPCIWEIYYCNQHIPGELLFILGHEFLRAIKQKRQ